MKKIGISRSIRKSFEEYLKEEGIEEKGFPYYRFFIENGDALKMLHNGISCGYTFAVMTNFIKREFKGFEDATAKSLESYYKKISYKDYSKVSYLVNKLVKMKVYKSKDTALKEIEEMLRSKLKDKEEEKGMEKSGSELELNLKADSLDDIKFE